MHPKITATIFCAVTLCLFDQVRPVQAQVKLNGATNGTVGPKLGIEAPLEQTLRESAPIFGFQPAQKSQSTTRRTIGPKSTIESPLEQTLRSSAPISWTHPNFPRPSAAVPSYRHQPIATSLDQVGRNDQVKPGLVTWHADFTNACRASTKSGKPVLLFQMMGNLNQEFC